MADVRAPPTPTAMLIGTAIVAGLSGYLIGVASYLGFLPIPFVQQPPKPRGISNYDDEEESEEEEVDEDEALLDHAPNWANGVEADKRDGLRAGFQKPAVAGSSSNSGAFDSSKEECKLVLVVRTDLGMTKGE